MKRIRMRIWNRVDPTNFLYYFWWGGLCLLRNEEKNTKQESLNHPECLPIRPVRLHPNWSPLVHCLPQTLHKALYHRRKGISIPWGYKWTPDNRGVSWLHPLMLNEKDTLDRQSCTDHAFVVWGNAVLSKSWLCLSFCGPGLYLAESGVHLICR